MFGTVTSGDSVAVCSFAAANPNVSESSINDVGVPTSSVVSVFVLSTLELVFDLRPPLTGGRGCAVVCPDAVVVVVVVVVAATVVVVVVVVVVVSSLGVVDIIGALVVGSVI